MFEFIKKEIQETRIEENELRAKIAEEERRIAEKRAKAKKNVFRKIKTIDKIQSKSEEKRDAKKIANFQAEKRQEMIAARSDRRKQTAKSNWKTLSIIAIAIIILIAGALSIGSMVHKNTIESNYKAAIDCIVNCDYDSALNYLKGVEIEDASELKAFCDIQNNFDEYKENTDKAISDLNNIKHIENKQVLQQYETMVAQFTLTSEIQKDIDKIETSSTTLDDKESIKKIADDMSKLDDRYITLLNAEKYDIASSTIKHLENNTDVGKTIAAIYAIGKVKLSSKDKLKKAKDLYNSLSDSEKKEVINYDILKSAKAKYKDLKEEEQARKEAQAEAKKEKEEYDNGIVYVPSSDNPHYHGAGCFTISRSKNLTKMTRAEAQRRSIPPCEHCSGM